MKKQPSANRISLSIPMFLIGTVIVIALAGLAGYTMGRRPLSNILPPPAEKGCTLDALICPDGTSVGRIPPSCNFAPCPTNDKKNSPTPVSSEDDTVICTMDAKLCSDGSYVGRTPPSCDFAACPGE